MGSFEGSLHLLDEDARTPVGIRYQATFGSPGLDLRQYWDPNGMGSGWAPTKKGVRIPEASYPEFLRAVFAVVLEWGPEELKAVRDAMLMAGWHDQVEAWERCVLVGMEDE